MSSDADTTDQSTTGRIRPHHLAIGLGVGIAIFTAFSGVLPLITDWHNDNEWHREVFGNIPGPLKIAFYTVIPVVLIYGSFQFAKRMKNWERGTPAHRRTTKKNAKRRAEDYRAGVYMQTLLRDSAAGLMHSMMYFGFLVLMGVTTVLEVDHQLPEDLKFLHGRTYQAYAFVGDAAGLVFGIGFMAPFGRSLSLRYMLSGDVNMWRSIVGGKMARNMMNETTCPIHHTWCQVSRVPTLNPSTVVLSG